VLQTQYGEDEATLLTEVHPRMIVAGRSPEDD
jgi:hypothetical protein